MILEVVGRHPSCSQRFGCPQHSRFGKPLCSKRMMGEVRWALPESKSTIMYLVDAWKFLTQLYYMDIFIFHSFENVWKCGIHTRKGTFSCFFVPCFIGWVIIPFTFHLNIIVWALVNMKILIIAALRTFSSMLASKKNRGLTPSAEEKCVIKSKKLSNTEERSSWSVQRNVKFNIYFSVSTEKTQTAEGDHVIRLKQALDDLMLRMIIIISCLVGHWTVFWQMAKLINY